ncbi:pilus assembly protein N-terminal domain-containing protein [Rhodopseudomonas palustris]|uniref:pilus assembly protein N-terminal domain-containing protein n=1 Tax=Rhodopseudomonas palustris TaxID=1076 RepID=UPI002ACEF615|nr:pilus assembly protein N-terminal domain-containing protein [Rhodopseudomonas palustris]WQG99994.1 pilus assembly protein N-terminal domain-containing protein [Rhodopseudomonas palustris]
MSTSSSRRMRAALVVSSFICGLMPLSAVSAGTEETVSVNVDQAKLIRLPQNISTLVVGNPLIADVAMQPGGMVVVTGKGYGATNVIAMDRKGTVIADRLIQVEGPDKVVTVYRGVDRESYSCTPVCQRRITLGDSEGYFKSTIDQAGNLNAQATGAATGPKGN